MRRFSPNFGFLSSLCLATFLVSAVGLAFASGEGALPSVPKLIPFQEAILFSPSAQYSTAGNQVHLGSGRLYLKPNGKAYQVSSELGKLQVKDGELFIDASLGKFRIAVETGQALLEVPGEKATRLSAGQLAQLAEPYFEGEGPLDSLGMDEGIDAPIRTLAFAEPGTILSTLALSEAAVGSSLLLPIIGGTAATAGLAATVGDLLDAREEADTPPPISL